MKVTRCVSFLVLTIMVLAVTGRADDCTYMQAQTESCPDGLGKDANGNPIPESATLCENQAVQDCDYYAVLLQTPTAGCAYLDGTSNCAKSTNVQLFKCLTTGECEVVNGKCKVDMGGYKDIMYATNKWYLETRCPVAVVLPP